MSWLVKLVVVVLAVIGGWFLSIAPNNAALADTMDDRNRPGFWQTEKAKFLDDAEVLAALRKALEKEGEGRVALASAEKLEDDIRELLFAELADGRGVHMETVLTAIGAMAGFSCQMVIREELIAKGSAREADVFQILETKDGQRYYTGDMINECLVEPKGANLSVWTLVAAAPAKAGKPLPEIVPMFKNLGLSYGTKKFGVPLLPAKNMPKEMPEALLWKYWNIMRNLQLTEQSGVSTMPFVLGHLAQRLIAENPTVIDPTLGARIVMEAAIPMSRIAPERVAYAYISGEK